MGKTKEFFYDQVEFDQSGKSTKAGVRPPSPERILDRIIHPYENTQYRVPFIFTSDMRIRSKIPPVRMKMNPTSVQVTQNKRITRRDTQAGAVFFHWTNETGHNNDVINIAFSGSTGNINLRTGMERNSIFSEGLSRLRERIQTATSMQGLDVESLSGASKLVNFWNLYCLTAEPVLDVENGLSNRAYFMYNSPLLGNQIVTFIGHFDKVLDFTDSADNPFSKDYNFSFVATESYPPMDKMYQSLSASLGDEFFNTMDEVQGI